MDADKDGLLSMGDVRAYFRTIGRNANDLAVRKWISSRDIDQDGAVSLVEFVSSYAMQLDPTSKIIDANGRLSDNQHKLSSIAEAFGALRLAGTVLEVIAACDAIEEYVRRILDSPSVKPFWRISVQEENFHRKIGRLFGGIKLMQAMGFHFESNSSVLAIHDSTGKEWDVIPQKVRIDLNRKLDELHSHRTSLLEPSISNIAAVSTAIGLFGDTEEKRMEWIKALETIHLILNNILSFPNDSKYFSINTQNPKFHQKVGRIQEAFDILRSFGFSESEGGNLSISMDTNMHELKARRLELEVGISNLKERVESDKTLNVVADQPTANGSTRITIPTDRGKGSKQAVKSISSVGEKSASANAISSSSKVVVLSTNKPIAADKGAKEAIEIEKIKRIKAEVALQQHKAVLHELQNQLYDLKEVEQTNLSLRYGMTISRLPDEEKTQIKKKMNALGKDSFGFTEPSTIDHLQLDKASQPKSKQHNGRENYDVVTYLNQSVEIGETRLPVADNNGFKKGMKVVVGSGTMMEVRNLIGFGSLIIDKGLSYDHRSNTPIFGFIPSAKNNIRIEWQVITGFCIGLLIEEIIPDAIIQAEKRLLDEEINQLYCTRPVLTNVYSIHNYPPVFLNHEQPASSSIIYSSEHAKWLTNLNGSIHAFDFSFGAIELISIFEELSHSVSAAIPNEVTSHDIDNCSISRVALLEKVDKDDYLRSSFQLLAESQYASTFQELLTRHMNVASDSDSITWSMYFRVIRGYPLKRNSVLALNSSIGYYGSSIDGLSFAMIVKIFDFYDTDHDDNMTDSEVYNSFTELDGSLPDPTIFSDVIQAVVGSYTKDTKVTLGKYLTIREQYAKKVTTVIAGMCLYGKCQLIVAATYVQNEDHEINNNGTVSISPCQVARAMPSSLLFMKYLPYNKTINDILEADSTKRPIEEVVHMLNRHVEFCGRRIHNQQLLQQDKDVYIVQLISDYTGKYVYALSSNGIAHVFDIGSNQKKFEQRVFWSEPLPIRNVEGTDKFVKWRKDMGLEHDRNSPDLHLNSIEANRISSLMSRFVLSLPPASGSLHSIAVDRETGLVAVNCSIINGTICFLEPLSLRRIYRIKSPFPISSELSDAIRGLSYGQLQHAEKFQYHNCHGAITSMEINSRRSIVICHVAGYKDIAIISLLSGDIIIELTGHTDMISCFTNELSLGLMFTGSVDQSVRVWRMDEVIPSYLAINSSGGNNSMQKLENTITNSVITGLGSTKLIKKVYMHLCARLGLKAHWRRGRVVSFYDAKLYHKEHSNELQTAAMEIVFENASIQLMSNSNALRDIQEITKAPNGPPLWSNQPAVLFTGQQVAVHEVDPDVLAIVLSRSLGVLCDASLSIQDFQSYLYSLFSESKAGIDKSDINLAFEAIGYLPSDHVRISTFVRKLYKLQERYQTLSDRYLTGNKSSILSIGYNNNSKLLFAIDGSGLCCVWDPCCTRSLLSISTTQSNIPIVGPFPYKLVACHSITSSLHLDYTEESPTIEIITNIKTLQLPIDLKLPFLFDSASLMKAYEIEKTLAATEDKVLKCYIYVMKDFSYTSIETSSFLPAMILMDNADLFLYSRFLLGSGGLSNLQAVYHAKENILRIIYAVSLSHDNIGSFVSDLSKYGVLHRGYSSTPSDRIEVVCFERQSDWSKYSGRTVGTDLNHSVKLLQTTPQHTINGYIVASMRGDDQRVYRVALLFSNDIIHVPENKIIRYLNKSVQLTRGFRTNNNSYDPIQGYAVGALVECIMDNPSKDKSISSSMETLSEISSVVIKVTNDLGDVSTYLLPLVFGRTSYPLPIKQLQHSCSISDEAKRNIKQSYLSRIKVFVGRLSLFSYLRSTYFSWQRSLQLFSTMMREKMIQFEQNTLSSLSSSLSIAATKNKTATNSHKEKINLVIIFNAFGSLNSSLFHFALNQLVSLLQQRAVASHPFMVFLESILDHQGDHILGTYGTKDLTSKKAAWSEYLDQFSRQWYLRKGMSVEELYHAGVNEYVMDVEMLVYRIQSRMNDDDAFNRQLLLPFAGSVIVQNIPYLLHKIGLNNENQSKDVVVTNWKSSFKKKKNILQFLLYNHNINKNLGTVVALSKKVRIDVKDTLCSYLYLLLHNMISSVKASLNELRAHKISHFSSTQPTHYFDDKPITGQYNVVSKLSKESPLYGISFEVFTAVRARNPESTPVNFLVWKYRHKDDGSHPSLVASVAYLTQILTNVHKDTRIIRIADGISFAAQLDTPCLVLEWNNKWKSLSHVIETRGSFLNQQKLELLRIIARNILDTTIDLHANNCAIRALNPSNVFIDQNGTDVVIVLLPPAMEIQCEKESATLSKHMLDEYIQYNRGNKMILSCIPKNKHLDNSIVQNIMSYGVAADVWSFGACLFIIAFGIHPHELEDGDFGDQKTIYGSLLYRLLHPLLQKNPQTVGKNSNNRKQTDYDFSSGFAIADALRSVLSERSKDIMFRMVHAYTGQTVDNLTKFRSSFCAESLSCGLTEFSMGNLWEKLMHNIFNHISSGSNDITKIQDKIASLPKNITEENCSNFLSDYLGIQLLPSELIAFINSLSITSLSKEHPFIERGWKCFRNLSNLLIEIFYYGIMQQILYIISSCFAFEPSAQVSLAELRKLSFFNTNDETSSIKATREGLLLLAPYHSIDEFYQSRLFKPLQRPLIRLIKASNLMKVSSTIESSSHTESSSQVIGRIRSDLEIISSCIGIFEDLMVIVTSNICDKAESTIGNTLTKTGADNNWLKDNAFNILSMALEQGYLQAVSLFLLRFLSTDYSKNLDNDNSPIKLQRDYINLKGLSLGSRLLSRISSFMQYLVNTLSAISKSLTITIIASPNLDTSEFKKKLKARSFCELLFNSTLTVLLMLYSGEEVPISDVGTFKIRLTEGHPYFLGHYTDGNNSLMSDDDNVDTRFNSQMCKIFESMLLELVAEDGCGSSKVSISSEMIRNTDKVLNAYFAALSLSFPKPVIDHNTSVLTNEHHMTYIIRRPPFFNKPVQSRGSFYFVALIRFIRGICLMEVITQSKSLEKAQQGVVSAAILLLSSPIVEALKPFETQEQSLQMNLSGYYIPDGQWLQKIQVVLDSRCSSRLQSYFVCQDNVLKLSLLKLCQRALCLCMSLPGELMETEPFLSLGR